MGKGCRSGVRTSSEVELNIAIDRAQRSEQLIEEKYAKWMTQENHEGDE